MTPREIAFTDHYPNTGGEGILNGAYFELNSNTQEIYSEIESENYLEWHVTDRLGISTSTIRDYIKAGNIIGQKNDGYYIVNRQSLLSFLDKSFYFGVEPIQTVKHLFLPKLFSPSQIADFYLYIFRGLDIEKSTMQRYVNRMTDFVRYYKVGGNKFSLDNWRQGMKNPWRLFDQNSQIKRGMGRPSIIPFLFASPFLEDKRKERALEYLGELRRGDINEELQKQLDELISFYESGLVFVDVIVQMQDE